MLRQIFSFLLIFSVFSFVYSENINADDKNSKKKKSSKKISYKRLNPSLMSISMKLNKLKSDVNFYGKPEKIASRWQVIINDIRKEKLSEDDAIDSLYIFTNQLWDFMNTRIDAGIIRKYSDAEWVFPIRGYGPNSIGGKNGSGYREGNFDFFDGSTGGHPAHDIFIEDRDQDSRDDMTGDYVEVLSMTGGIVIETRKDWTTDRMDIRGGNMVYVYDNYTNGLFYYAHMEDVFVDEGDYVEPGTPIGTVGRTGKNAYPSRSPTHLHLMYVRSFDGDLLPEDIYNDLINVKTIY